MNDFTSTLLTYMGIYSGVVLLCLAAINFFMGGIFLPWLKVKLSRGKKVLVRIRTVVQDYYKPGIIDKGFLVYTDREKEERRLAIVEGCVYRGMGINNIDIDDETNSVVKHDFSLVSGFDAVKHNYLYIRALFRPEQLNKELKILLVLLILCLIGIAAAVYLGYDVSEKVAALSNIPVAGGGTLAGGAV